MELHLTATECHLPYVTYHPTQVNYKLYRHYVLFVVVAFVGACGITDAVHLTATP